ncbi:MAG: immunoglobulin domain-containing protein [Verrucomicrobia bacterium]|nr:immunoglobulin domain-containing protein [Verrucomicrobiota bacterium]
MDVPSEKSAALEVGGRRRHEILGFSSVLCFALHLIASLSCWGQGTPPSIVTQPQSQTATTGSSVRFSVTAFSNTPVTYQWFRNNISLPGQTTAAPAGQTSATLMLAKITTNDSGNYTVLVGNSAGSSFSLVATLTVLDAIVVTPAAPNIVVGGKVQFTATGRFSDGSSRVLTRNSGSWELRTAMPTARRNAHPVNINGILYVVGGHDGKGVADKLEAYNPALNNWTTLAPLPRLDNGDAGRDSGTVGVINGNLFLAGGWRISPPLPTSTLQAYDPVRNSWSQNKNMPNLSGCSAGGVLNGRLYVMTPCDGFNGYRQFLHAYDPSAGWAQRASIPSIHVNAAAGVIDGKLYVAGGTDGTVPTSTLEVYDPGSNSWTKRAPMPSARANLAGAVLNEQLYAIGGHNGKSDVTTVEIYDPNTDTWETGVPISSPRSALAAAVIDGKIFLVGGIDLNGPLSTLEVFTPLTWTSSAPNVASVNASGLAIGLTPGSATIAASVSNVRGSATATVVSAERAPTISSQPQNLTATAGTSVTFTVAANGSAPLSYQWRKNGASISGATAPSLTLSNVQSSDAGTYVVAVSNSAGSVTSAPATLTVTAPSTPPAIIAQPQSQTVIAGANATFSVTASGTAPLNFQWRKDPVNIAGATGANYTIRNVQASHAGVYSVVVSNGAGAVTSAGAALKVVVPGDDSIEVRTLAGAGSAGSQDGFGDVAKFSSPNGGYVGPERTSYIADGDNHRIRKIDLFTGEVSTIAGEGRAGYLDGPALSALFNLPLGLVANAAGEVFVADSQNHRIRKISRDEPRTVTTVAGSGIQGYADGSAKSAQFNFPNDFAIDSSGNLFVLEFNNHTVRKITPDGAVSTLVGNGKPGTADGVGSNAQLNSPSGIAIDVADNLYVAEWQSHRIRKVTPVGLMTTFAGSGVPGFDDGFGRAASFKIPDGIALDPLGNLYITEQGNHAIRKISSEGTVTTLAGVGKPGFVDGNRAAAQFNAPGGIGWDVTGNLVVADTGNHSVRKVQLFLSPKIMTPPQSQTAASGASAKFQVEVGGTGPFAYQWLFDGRPIQGATNATFALSNVQVANAGSYMVVAGNPAGSVTSAAALLTVRTPLNTPPTISRIPDQSIREDSFSRIAFLIDDVQSSPDKLRVIASSSNSALLPQGSIVVSRNTNNVWSVNSWLAFVYPAENQAGDAAITITATDEDGGASRASFALTVIPVNDPPIILKIPDQAAVSDEPLSIEFSIGDADTPANNLVLTASSSNPSVISPANMVFKGSGTNRTVTITPKASQTVSVRVIITVDDGTNRYNEDFQVTVFPAEGLRLLSPQFSAGRVQLQLTGVRGGTTYVVEASADLMNWISILTTNAPSSATFLVTDPNGASLDRRFYRVRRP